MWPRPVVLGTRYLEWKYVACSQFNSQKHGGRPVVVIGGGSLTAKILVLDYTRPESTWEQGK